MKANQSCICLLSLSIVPTFAQAPRGVTLAPITNNRLAVQRLHHNVKSSRITPKVVVFVGDTVIPQVADGATWQTSFIIRNLESSPRHCRVLFFNDDGTDLQLPIVGVGTTGAIDVNLNAGETAFFETPGTSPELLQGWASIVKDNADDSIGGMAVFRQSIPGMEPSEAVVPVVSQFDDHFVLVFDKTNTYITSMAIANPTLNDVVATATIMDEFGNIIDQQSLTLPSYHHQAFAIPSTWSSTAGRRGRSSLRRAA